MKLLTNLRAAIWDKSYKKGAICCRDSTIYFGAFFAVKNANQWPQMYNSVHGQLAESAAIHYAQNPKIVTKDYEAFLSFSVN